MEDSEKSSVPEHLEQYLGEIAHGWSGEDELQSIQVVCFNGKPQQGTTTYATLGLNDMILAMKGTRTIRQELVISACTSFPEKDIARFLLYCAEKIKKRGHALLRGEVVNMGYPLIEGATVTALYSTNPTPFDDGFSEFRNTTPPVIFVLLVPITDNEVSLINKYGWNWFEDMLETQDPDIWDLKRSHEIEYR
ncbi:hypothetical protein GGQ64_001257 [Rhizobium azooxidifex]|uniref:Suppressor of fused-like domain-containing protein n=1 Tax=Mycoplana azooxidifex TaxID=1636188 RepID=A0A7W6GI34_9HYPH|nr:suppressor of fused domain protein [Mycoplana azooxidifex]MBB3976070.1 hypothetical protein [Mycoplana azooxidifex]